MSIMPDPVSAVAASCLTHLTQSKRAMNQPSLFDNEPDTPTRQTFVLGDSEIQYVSNAFTAREADRMFQKLLEDIPWQTATLTIAGQKRSLPRLQCWMADEGRSYSYSGLTLTPQPWNPDVLRVLKRGWSSYVSILSIRCC